MRGVPGNFGEFRLESKPKLSTPLKINMEHNHGGLGSTLNLPGCSSFKRKTVARKNAKLTRE